MSEPSNKSDSVTVSKEDTIMSETSTEVSKPSSEGAGNEASELSTEVSKRRSEGVDETSKVSKEITNEILSELCSRLRVIIAKVTEMKASDNNDLKKVIFCFSFYPSVMLKSI
jgi:PAB1-binding protein PBP1